MSETIKHVMEALVSVFDKETLQNNQETVGKIQKIYEEQPGDFLDVIQLAQEDFRTLVESVMNIPESDDMYICEHIINGLYKHFHTQRIEKLEGSTCCYDKSTFIESMTLKAIRTQQNLSLFDDYQNVEQIKEDKERQAYWSPRTIKDTDEAIELFWNWYQFS